MTPSGWAQSPLASLANYINGRAFKPEDWTTSGLPIIRIAQITNPDAETNYYVGQDVDARHLIDDGDVLFSWSATLAVMKWNRGPAILNQHIFKVVEKPGVDKDFLVQLLRGSIDKLAEHSHGSTMKHIKKGVLDQFQVPVPPLPEQKKIAAILSSVDDAIRSTQAVIDQTRKVKQGLLQQLLTRGIGHTRFKQTEIGEIPEGWDVISLAEAGEWLSGGTPSRAQPEFWNGSVPWVSPKDMKRPRLSDAIEHVSDLGAVSGTKLVPPGTVLIVVRGMILAHSFPVATLERTCAFNQDIKALITCPRLNPHFVRLWLEASSNQFLDLISEATHGTKRMPSDSLFASLMPCPPLSEQRQICDGVLVAEDQVDAQVSYLEELSQLKKGLMSDLLSGRTRVEIPA